MINEITVVVAGSTPVTSEIAAVAVNMIPDWTCGVRYASEAVGWSSAHSLPGRGHYGPQALTGRPSVFPGADSPDGCKIEL